MAHMMLGMTLPDGYRIAKLRDSRGPYWRAIGPKGSGIQGTGILMDELPSPEDAAKVCWDHLSPIERKTDP